MSGSSSLLIGGLVSVSLISVWSSLPAGCSNFMIVGLISDSAGFPVVVESEALSAYAAHDLRFGDRADVTALIVIGLAPLFLHRPGHTAATWWIDFWQVQRITAIAVVDFL